MKYDLCILGAGPAGYSGALRAAMAGMKVALVEKSRVGGTCLNAGCIPTKSLRQCATAWLETKTSERFGVVLPGPASFNFSLAAKHRDQVTETLVSGVASLLKARKVALFSGEGKIMAPGKVLVRNQEEATEIQAENIVIATGSRTCNLPGLNIDETFVLSPETAIRLSELPQRALVVGGGVIGCEFADLLATFGVQVWVVEAMDRILISEDRQTSRLVQKSLESRGVKFFLSTTVSGVSAGEEGISVQLTSGEELRVDKVIVSVGRRPAVEGLGLAEVGVELAGQAVKVDGGGRTTAPGIFAAGDVIGPPMLAHAAAQEMEVVIKNLLGQPAEFEREVIPTVVFVEPEVASVGLLEDKAKEKGMAVEVGRFSYAANGKALCLGRSEGWAKVITAKEDHRLLGATIVGAHAGELIHELALAIKARLKIEEVMELVHAHPTLSEIVVEAVADVQGLALHKVGRTREVKPRPSRE